MRSDLKKTTNCIMKICNVKNKITGRGTYINSSQIPEILYFPRREFRAFYQSLWFCAFWPFLVFTLTLSVSFLLMSLNVPFIFFASVLHTLIVLELNLKTNVLYDLGLWKNLSLTITVHLLISQTIRVSLSDNNLYKPYFTGLLL